MEFSSRVPIPSLGGTSTGVLVSRAGARKRDTMTIRKTVATMAALVAISAMWLPLAHAQNGNSNRRTVLTFSKPFEIPGHVLPAGTYTFQLADTLADRHILQVSSADGKEQLALVMGIEVSRIDTTTQTVITFNEVPTGSPETIRTWFYPGRTSGVEFVYPKSRAIELAAASKVIVPAFAVEAASPDLKSVPLVAIAPDRRELPVAAAAQAASIPAQAAQPPAQPQPVSTIASAGDVGARELPRTASTLPLLAGLGVTSLAVAAVALMLARRLRPATDLAA
jgi:hypothetical protein